MILFDLIPEAQSLSLNGTNRLRQSAKRDLTKKNAAFLLVCANFVGYFVSYFGHSRKLSSEINVQTN